MFKKILVPLDRSSLAEQALGQATAIARKSNAGIDIILVHQPIPYAGFSDIPWYGDQWKEELTYVEGIATELEKGSGVFTTFAVPKGDVVDEICKRALDVDADLVVMTSHGRTGLSRVWLGSVADGVIRHSKVPVLMLRPPASKKDVEAAHGLFKHLVITLDGSTLSEEILSPALALARGADARVTLLRVVQPVPMLIPDAAIPFAYTPPMPDPAVTKTLAGEAKEELDASVRRIRAQGFKADCEVVVSPRVAQSILEFAESRGADMIALSTHGRGASRLIVGSTADKVIRASNLPVLLQRPVGVRNVERLAAPAEAEAASPAMAHV